MCDFGISESISASLIAGISLAATAVSTMVSVVGAVQQAKSAQNQMNYQAKVAQKMLKLLNKMPI